MFFFIMFSSQQSWSSSWNIPICPLNFLEGNLNLEFCTSWSGLKWGSVQSSHGITLNYSIRWSLFIVAYDLLIWGKEEGGKKGFHLFLLSFPSCPLIKTLTLYRGLFYFSPCFRWKIQIVFFLKISVIDA